MNLDKVRKYIQYIVFILIEIVFIVGCIYVNGFILKNCYQIQGFTLILMILGFNFYILYYLNNISEKQNIQTLDRFETICSFNYSTLKVIADIYLCNNALIIETELGKIVVNRNLLLKLKNDKIKEIDNYLFIYLQKNKFDANLLSLYIKAILNDK